MIGNACDNAKVSKRDGIYTHSVLFSSLVLLTLSLLVSCLEWCMRPTVRRLESTAAKGQVLWVREGHFNNSTAIRALHRRLDRAPPQPRGVNSRPQMSRPARLIHHPLCLPRSCLRPDFVGSLAVYLLPCVAAGAVANQLWWDVTKYFHQCISETNLERHVRMNHSGNGCYSIYNNNPVMTDIWVLRHKARLKILGRT